MPDMRMICDLLHRLGATENYTGFPLTSYAVFLAVERPDRLLMVTKVLYPEVARYYMTTVTAVERNIRTIVGKVWDENLPLLDELAHRHLHRKPTSSQFLAILASQFLHEFPPFRH